MNVLKKIIDMSMLKKIIVFSCMIPLGIIILFFYIAKASLTDFGLYAYRVNEKQIRSTSRFYLSQVAIEQARVYDQAFEKISAVSSLMGRQLAQIYRRLDQTPADQHPGAELPMSRHPQTGLYYTQRNHDPIVAYWGGPRLTADAENEISALIPFFPTLMKAKERLAESIAVHVITQSGIGVYLTLNEVARQACFELPSPSVFDLRDGEPVTVFTRSRTRHHDTRWTRIYKDDVIADLMMTATTPVYDMKNQFRAITGIDIPVGQIVRNLDSHFPVGRTGEHSSILFSFLITSDGKLIAFPKEFMHLFKLDIDWATFKNSADVFDYGLYDSSAAAIRDAGKAILEPGADIVEVTIEDETYLMAVGVLNAVQWRLVFVAKESEMMASLEKTRSALDKSLDNVWQDFVGHSVVIVIFSVLIVFCMIHIFIRPIRAFIAATQKVASGDLSTSLRENGRDELGQLARSFNLMVEKLKISDNLEKQQARELEKRIKQRTFELEKSNEQLNQIKNSLEKTVMRRTEQLIQLNEHLVDAEELERKEMASDLHDSVTQTLAMAISKLKDTRESFPGEMDGRLSQVQAYMEQSIREIRALIYKLSPPVLDDFDIVLALGFLIEDTNEKHQTRLVYNNHVSEPVHLVRPLKVTIYRAVNELITNILKHAGTLEGQIDIYCDNQALKIIVADKGCGFDREVAEHRETWGFGLRSLTQRIKNFQGSVDIDTRIGYGTKITLILPVRKPEDS